MADPLVVLDRVTIPRAGRDALRDFSWTIREGETWAVSGPVGSGKTTLAETILGKQFARSGSVSWPMLDGRPGLYPSSVIRHVAFQEQSRLFSYVGHYYQQRFEFADADEPLTLEQFLGPDCSRVAKQLGIEAQLPLSFMKLSNGQTRRARIAQALLAKPELLILDDPFLGVDASGRAEIAALLGGLVKSGLRLVLICSPDAVPSWVTHRLELGAQAHDPHLSPGFAGERSESKPRIAVSTPGEGVLPSDSETPPSPAVLMLDASARRPLPRKAGGEVESGSPIIELRNVSVAHGGRTILRDIDWTVRAGERWAVFGPNGSGKTTLLSLLCGDHPQAYSNDVKLFGRRRGTGESIWDVKRRIGLLSPEFHLYFSEPLNAERVAATGFFDGVADRPTTPEQNRAVQELFVEFRLLHLNGRPFRQLSTGEQRLVLLVRALVKRPELLILDEPFQSLDSTAMRHARDWLDRRLGPDQTLLFVSHFEDELPACIGHRLNLS